MIAQAANDKLKMLMKKIIVVTTKLRWWQFTKKTKIVIVAGIECAALTTPAPRHTLMSPSSQLEIHLNAEVSERILL